VVQVYNFSTWEDEAGGLKFEARLSYTAKLCPKITIQNSFLMSLKEVFSNQTLKLKTFQSKQSERINADLI
jgi:hypothetical protein